jgi:DNA-binding SARP family transcriptional activator
MSATRYSSVISPYLDSDPLDEGLRIFILGPLMVWRDGIPVDIGRPGQRAVLGRLALTPDTWVSRDDIIADLWGDKASDSAVAILKSHISRLRTVLDPGAEPRARARDGIIIASGRNYRLRVDSQLDVITCKELQRAAHHATREGDRDSAFAIFDKSLSLWRGEPLADIDALRGHWVTASLVNFQTALLTEFAAAAFPLGRYAEVLPHLQRAAAARKMDEHVHSLLMLALAGSGQQAYALDVFESIRNRLKEELGVTPSPGLRKAHLQILRQEFSSIIVNE